MGACCSDEQDTLVGNEMGEAAKNDQIVKKLLFLGSGGSGKSTIFKQLKTIHGEGFKATDKMKFVPHIHTQIVTQMKLAIENIELMNEEAAEKNSSIDNQSNSAEAGNADATHDDEKQGLLPFHNLSEGGKKAAECLKTMTEEHLSMEVAEHIKTLWKEPEIQKMYGLRAITKIEDTSAYFWDKIDTVMAEDYVPDENDILFVRYRTTGIVEQAITVKNHSFKIFDVGGQMSERKKWIHCFESVTAVIFVASLSCYDELMFELDDVNSMVDTLALFSNICNNQWFQKTAMILFLNKTDLFGEKITRIPITECADFSSFGGDTESFLETTAYIKNEFAVRNQQRNKSVFIHLTCATNRANVQTVFNDVQHVVVEASLTMSGILG